MSDLENLKRKIREYGEDARQALADLEKKVSEV